MHAVIVDVTIHDPEQAGSELRDQVVPAVSRSPGFQAGYWVGFEGNKGTSIVVFDSEESARAAAERAQAPGDFITFDRVEVGEVVASA